MLFYVLMSPVQAGDKKLLTEIFNAGQRDARKSNGNPSAPMLLISPAPVEESFSSCQTGDESDVFPSRAI